MIGGMLMAEAWREWRWDLDTVVEEVQARAEDLGADAVRELEVFIDDLWRWCVGDKFIVPDRWLDERATLLGDIGGRELEALALRALRDQHKARTGA